MKVEVVYLTQDKDFIKEVMVDNNSNALSAIITSGLLQEFPKLKVEQLKIGVFGNRVTLDYILQANDRVEVYRDLLIDPKEKRRKREQQ